MAAIRRRRWFVLPTLLLLAVPGFWLHSWWQSPATTVIVPQFAQSAGDVLGSQTTLINWQTQYFSTKIPSSLQLKSVTEDATKPIAGSYLLTSANGQQNDQVAITIGQLGGSSLSDISAVKLRLNDPADYTQTTRSNTPAGSIVFTKVTNYETAVFWQHDSRYVAVVVSGTADRRPDLEQALNAIIGNWQWL